MKSALSIWILGLGLLQISSNLFGQQTFPDLAEAAFGLDQDLVNGVQDANRYQRILGNPYFLEKGFTRGKVLLDEKTYTEVRLRYDLYAQRVLIEYQGAGGNFYSLVAVSERLSEFSLAGFKFVRRTLPSEPDQYYQIVSTDFFTTYVHWEKILLANNNSIYYSDHFSNPRLSYYLEMDGSVFPFHNRKDFASLFPEEWAREIRSLLRKQRIKFKNARATDIVEAMADIEKLMQSREKP